MTLFFAAFLAALPMSAQAAPAETNTIVSLVNQARAQHGIPPLRVNPSLTVIAQDWSQHQASVNAMSHRPNITTGYPSGWTAAGENVAWNTSSNPQNIFNGWMNSTTGHRENILSPSFTDIGVGWARSSSGRYYATQSFAGYRGNTVTSPTPTGATGNKDYNGDGKADVLALSNTGQLILYPGNGNNGWGKPVTIGNGWSGYKLITPGDFNGNRYADILGVAPNGNLYFYAGTGSGFAARVQIGHGWQGMTNVFSPGDFSGDGKADIIATTASGDMRIYYGTGTGRVSGSTKIGHGWQIYSDVFSGGDFNGDNRTDIFARDRSGSLFAYYGRGNSTMQSRVQIGNGWSGFDHLSSIGDFSGDGRSDLLGIDSRSGNAYLYPGTGRGTFGTRVQVGNGWGNFETVR